MILDLSDAQISTILKALQDSVVIRATLRLPVSVDIHEVIAAIGQQTMANGKPAAQPEAPPSAG